jgi:hypothetical protein
MLNGFAPIFTASPHDGSKASLHSPQRSMGWPDAFRDDRAGWAQARSGDPERMPALSALMARGTRFAEARSVFPSETRVATPSLVTGCRPASHGMVGNTVFDATLAPDRLLRTKEPADFLTLSAGKESPLQRLTIGERLAAAGRSFAVVSAGTPGQTLVAHPAATRLGQFRWNAADVDTADAKAAAARRAHAAGRRAEPRALAPCLPGADGIRPARDQAGRGALLVPGAGRLLPLSRAGRGRHAPRHGRGRCLRRPYRRLARRAAGCGRDRAGGAVGPRPCHRAAQDFRRETDGRGRPAGERWRHGHHGGARRRARHLAARQVAGAAGGGLAGHAGLVRLAAGQRPRPSCPAAWRRSRC